MESRKYQLQKQIIEALKLNDDDLYSLLKSQWAHRFGVDSLEELKNLDLAQQSENLSKSNIQKTVKSKEISSDIDKAVQIREKNDQQKVMKINDFESFKDDNESLKFKSYQAVAKENDSNKAINSSNAENSLQKIEALIPLPPKPKYGYLKRWLLSK